MSDEQDASKTAEWKGEQPEIPDSSVAPSTPQVNRSREQGLGVGQKDLDLQRDPTGANSADQYGSGQGVAPPPEAPQPESARNLDDVRDQSQAEEG